MQTENCPNKITFGHPIGIQPNGNFISEEVLLKGYLDSVGYKLEGTDYTIIDAYVSGDSIFVNCIKLLEDKKTIAKIGRASCRERV